MHDIYDLADDYLERRAALRDEHLALAWRASKRSELIQGAALSDPVETAVLLFEGDSPEVAERFASTDPYVKHGLVTGWRVRRWHTVVGETSHSPTGSETLDPGTPTGP